MYFYRLYSDLIRTQNTPKKTHTNGDHTNVAKTLKKKREKNALFFASPGWVDRRTQTKCKPTLFWCIANGIKQHKSHFKRTHTHTHTHATHREGGKKRKEKKKYYLCNFPSNIAQMIILQYNAGVLFFYFFHRQFEI